MAAPAARLRQHLSAPGLIGTLRQSFSAVPDTRRQGSVDHSMADALGAAFAMFHLKFPSMLGFDEAAHADPRLIHNLRTLYRLGSVPSDTQMREILDRVPPEALRPAFEAIHAELQRGKVLEDFVSLEGRYLLAIDGTGTLLFDEGRTARTAWSRSAPRAPSSSTPTRASRRRSCTRTRRARRWCWPSSRSPVPTGRGRTTARGRRSSGFWTTSLAPSRADAS